MTQQQREERKAEQEVFSHLRATRREIRKEQERMGLDAYNAQSHREIMEDMENYCRAHPGVQVVKVGNGYMLKDMDGTSVPPDMSGNPEGDYRI